MYKLILGTTVFTLIIITALIIPGVVFAETSSPTNSSSQQNKKARSDFDQYFKWEYKSEIDKMTDAHILSAVKESDSSLISAKEAYKEVERIREKIDKELAKKNKDLVLIERLKLDEDLASKKQYSIDTHKLGLIPHPRFGNKVVLMSEIKNQYLTTSSCDSSCTVLVRFDSNKPIKFEATSEDEMFKPVQAALKENAKSGLKQPFFQFIVLKDYDDFLDKMKKSKLVRIEKSLQIVEFDVSQFDIKQYSQKINKSVLN